MNYPPMPMQPWEAAFQEHDVDVVIYSDYEFIIVNEDITETEFFQDWDEENIPQHPEKRYKQITMQDLLDKLPADKSAADVKMRMRFPTRYNEYLVIEYYYQTRKTADPEGFKQALQKYHEKYAQWEKDHAAWLEWDKQQAIQKLEEKIAQLKK